MALSPRLAAALAALLAALSTSAPARADDAAFKRYAHEWFDGERTSGYVWGAGGLVSLGAGSALYFTGKDKSIERGMAYPLLAVGLLQTGIGIGARLRPHGRDNDFDALLARSPEEARKSEIDRMRTLNYAFLAIELTELVVLAGGAAYAATRTREDQALGRGVGLGLALEGGLMLLLDSLAAARAHTYAGQLDAVSVSISPAPGAQSVSFSGVF